MMKIRFFLFSMILAVLFSVIFSSCGKTEISPVSTAILDDSTGMKLISFSPTSGHIGSEAIISGSNFVKGTDTLIKAIIFGGKSSKIISYSTNEIKVEVPDTTPGKYKITVRTGTKEFVFPDLFEIMIEDTIKLISFSPSSGKAASQVTIRAENLIRGNDSLVKAVKFDNYPAKVLSYTNNELVVEVPNISFGKYHITLSTVNQEYIFPELFEIPFPPDDVFLDFKNLAVRFNNMHVIYRDYHYFKWYPNINDSNDISYLKYNYWIGYANATEMEVKRIGTYEYDLTEYFYRSPSIKARFKIDMQNKKMKYFYLYLIKGIPTSDPNANAYYMINMILEELPIITINEAYLMVNIRGVILDKIINSLMWKEEGQYSSGHKYSGYTKEISKLFPCTDSSSLELKIYK